MPMGPPLRTIQHRHRTCVGGIWARRLCRLELHKLCNLSVSSWEFTCPKQKGILFRIRWYLGRLHKNQDLGCPVWYVISFQSYYSLHNTALLVLRKEWLIHPQFRKLQSILHHIVVHIDSVNTVARLLNTFLHSQTVCVGQTSVNLLSDVISSDDVFGIFKYHARNEEDRYDYKYQGEGGK